jgi:hypothetical protein
MRVRGREDLGAIGNEQASPDGPFGVESTCVGSGGGGYGFPPRHLEG